MCTRIQAYVHTYGETGQWSGTDSGLVEHKALTEETSMGRRNTMKKERNQMQRVRTVTRIF